MFFMMRQLLDNCEEIYKRKGKTQAERGGGGSVVTQKFVSRENDMVFFQKYGRIIPLKYPGYHLCGTSQQNYICAYDKWRIFDAVYEFV